MTQGSISPVFPRPLTWLALAMAATACSGAPQPRQLASLETLEPGEECPDGGVVVLIGEDTDGDGVLSKDEVQEEHVVCHGEPGSEGDDGADGADGTSSFVDVTDLPPGDEDCPHGGVRIEVGTEDPDGHKEVAHTFYDCDPPSEPTPIPGQFEIDLSGGEASAGDGGAGGSFSIAGEDVVVRNTGEVSPFAEKPSPTTWLGDDPAEVQGEVTVPLLEGENGVPDDSSALLEGDLFLIHDPDGTGIENHLYVWDGDVGVEATGLHVEPGAELAFEGDDSGYLWLQFTADILNEGTITSSGFDTIQLNPGGSFLGTGTSSLAVEGTLYLYPSDLIFNEGDVEVHPSPDMGWPPMVDFWTDLVVNRGDITAHGTADGGGGIVVEGSGGVYTDGALQALGVDGDGGGASGGSVFVSGAGSVWSGGPIHVDAGQPNGTCADGCDPANGGSVTLSSWGSSGNQLRHAGDITANGTGSGGNGGNVNISGPGSAHIGGSIQARGGSDDEGGAGGQVEINGSGDITLYGVLDILLDGGSGADAGGPGGQVEMTCKGGDGGEMYSAMTASTPAGQGVVNHAGLSATGGPGGDGDGGAGGVVVLVCEGSDVEVLNAGTIDVRGGASSEADGGWAGSGILAGGHVHNEGVISADGGAGEVEGGDGGEAIAIGASVTNEAFFSASGGPGEEAGQGGVAGMEAQNVWNMATLEAAGGEGTQLGGSGGFAAVYAFAVLENSGDLLSPGGDATAAAGVGGDGGEVEVHSQSFNSVHTGVHDVTGGSGNVQDGEPGEAWIDGIPVSDD